MAGVLVKIMNSLHMEHNPAFAERFATHRWGPQIARELQQYTPSSAYIDSGVPPKVPDFTIGFFSSNLCVTDSQTGLTWVITNDKPMCALHRKT